MAGLTQARRAIALCAALALPACQSAGIDDLAPSAAIAEPAPAFEAGVPVPGAAPRADAAVEPSAAPARETASGAPENTGEFPKIGNVPVGETAQLGAGGAAALRGGLSAARASQASAAGAPESYAEKLRRLRLLQAKHAAETLAVIEARKPQ